MAITWRSLMGQTTDPVRAMGAAQDSFNSMFSGLNSALDKYNTGVEKTKTEANEATKQSFLNQLYGINTVEGFNQQQEALLSQIGSMDPKIQAAVREAYNSRLPALMQQESARQKWDDSQAERGQRDVVAGLQDALTRASNPEEVSRIQEAIGIYQSAGMLNTSGGTTLNKEGQSRTSDLEKKLREDTRFNWDVQDRNYLEGTRAFEREKEAAADTMVQAALAHRANLTSIGQEQGQAAKDLGLPITSNGLPDMVAISANPAFKSAFDELVAARNIQLPSDTDAFRNALAVAQQSGASGAALLPLLSQGEMFNTTQGNLLVGAEKAMLERNEATIREKEKEIKEGNSLYISSKNVLDKLPDLNKKLKDAGLDSGQIRDVAKYVQQHLKDNPDQPLHIPAIVSQASTTPSWWEEDRGGLGDAAGWTDWFNTYEGRFKRQMQEALGTDAYRSQLAEFERLKQVEEALLRAREKAANDGKVPYR